MKKGLKSGSVLDFSTLNLRKACCQEEVDINKVLCGNMYRRVVKIVQPEEMKRNDWHNIRVVNLNGAGRALEFAIKMLEIPQEFRMDNVLEKGKINSTTIEKLTSKLLKFQKSSLTNSRIRRYGLPEFMLKKLDENFVTLSKLANVSPKFEQTQIICQETSSSLSGTHKG